MQPCLTHARSVGPFKCAHGHVPRTFKLLSSYLFGRGGIFIDFERGEVVAVGDLKRKRKGFAKATFLVIANLWMDSVRSAGVS